MAQTLADLQADLDIMLAARRRLMETGEEFFFDSGQGRQSSKLRLKDVEASITRIKGEIAELENGDTGLMTGSFRRFG